MADYDNRDRGVLFHNSNKKHEKAPDWSGSFELSKDKLKELIELAKADVPIKFKIDGWYPKDGSKGHVGLKYNDYKPEKKQDPLNDEVPF